MKGEGSALVLFAHGSRDPEWAQPFRTLQQRVAARRAGLAVELAFLELMQPTLPDAVERLSGSGYRRITIAPVFMAQGAHLKRDLARIFVQLKERHPEIELVLLPAAGEVDDVLEAMSTWLTNCV